MLRRKKDETSGRIYLNKRTRRLYEYLILGVPAYFADLNKYLWLALSVTGAVVTCRSRLREEFTDSQDVPLKGQIPSTVL